MASLTELFLGQATKGAPQESLMDTTQKATSTAVKLAKAEQGLKNNRQLLKLQQVKFAQSQFQQLNNFMAHIKAQPDSAARKRAIKNVEPFMKKMGLNFSDQTKQDLEDSNIDEKWDLISAELAKDLQYDPEAMNSITRTLADPYGVGKELSKAALDTRVKTSQQEAMTERQRLAMEQKEGVREEQKILRGKEFAAKQFDKKQIPDLVTTFNDLESVLGARVEEAENVPGFDSIQKRITSGIKVPFTELEIGQTALSPEGKRTMQAVQGLLNQIIKKRSGAAVTQNEAERLMKEIGAGKIQTEAQLIAGLRRIKRTIREDIASIRQGTDVKAFDTFVSGLPETQKFLKEPKDQSRQKAINKTLKTFAARGASFELIKEFLGRDLTASELALVNESRKPVVEEEEVKGD